MDHKLLLAAFLLALPSSLSVIPQEYSPICSEFVVATEQLSTFRITLPADNELLPGGQHHGFAFSGSNAYYKAGVTTALLIDSALVAYGFNVEDGVELAALEEGEHEVVLAAASNTGAATWKSPKNLCVLDRTLFRVARAETRDVHEEGEAGAVILSPPSHARLLLSENYMLNFTVVRGVELSMEAGGVEVRERGWYEEGNYDTPMDWLHQGPNALSLILWHPQPQSPHAGEDEELVYVETERVELQVLVVPEPPSVMFQFPPDDFVFSDPANVNVALLVTYFAFHRYPRLEGGHLLIRVDWKDALQSAVGRDGEGVFEVTMTLGAPYNSEGFHQLSVQLIDTDGRLVGGSSELLFRVDSRAAPALERSDAELPLGRWATEPVRKQLRKWVAGGGEEEEGGVCRTAADCSGHGECRGREGGRGGLCACAGDWIGVDCATSLWTDTSYLPPKLPYEMGARVQLAGAMLNGSHVLLRELQALHVTANCHADKAFLFDYNDQGLAAQVSDASVQLSFAFKHGKAAALVGEWSYGLHHGCAHAPGVPCHFHPHFQCDAEGLGLPQPDFAAHPRDVIPDAYKERGAFWWYAVVTAYLLQTNLEMQLKLAAAKAALGFRHPAVAVHVRNGDYCSFENDDGGLCLMYRHCLCDGFEPYLERIRRMKEKYGIATVLLATQDERIVQAAKAEPGLTVLALDFDRGELTGKGAKKALHWRQKQGYVDAEMVAESALLDLFLLADCDAFVGAFHSQYSRLAYQLMAMRQGVHPPFDSVHLAWGETLTFPL